ncbi:TadE/TadG family type IV pilus assembly protein [Bremerella cremea]|uniref:TadE/TadG family type IV pilus assembly protein n=1 Tax=Bremerella cremea TaxID=1031537 RepID=UPI0031EF1D0A
MNTSNPIRDHRRGATLVEGALVMMILFVTLFGIFDFGLAVVRQNMLDEAAYRLARAGAIRGEDSQLDQWGPVTIESVLGDEPDLLSVIGPANYLIDTRLVNVRMAWEEGMATTNSELTVTLQYNQPLLLGGLWGVPSIPLASRVVERIE